MRMCCGCNKRFEQHRLIRLQVSPETQAVVPVERKVTGRSAWVCFHIECIRKICKHPKRLSRSLRARPRVDLLTETLYDWVLEKLRKQIEQMHKDGVVAVSTYCTHKPIPHEPYIFPVELYSALHLDCLNLNSEQVMNDEYIQIHKHHLLQSTIRYADLWVGLKLDSIA